ncbi:MAG: hypothetical protein Q9160_003653 [Pyrenula sp. 1 TL-2023]
MPHIHSDSYSLIFPEKYVDTLCGQVVLVTGSGRGIGRSIALAFANAGAAVACLSRTTSENTEVAAEIKATFGVPALAVTADVSDPEAPKRVIGEIEKALGPIDILVNNAAISKINTLEHETHFESWWRILEVNFRGPAAFTQAVLPEMLKRDRGSIMSVASRCGSDNVPYTSAYSSSKAALIRFHHVLALEIGSRHVYTYIVQPGDVATNLSKGPNVINMETLRDVPGMRSMLQATVGQCTETPQLIADTFVMLAVDQDAKMLTGKCINAKQNIGQVIDDAKKKHTGRIAKERLYVLKVDEL